MIGHVIEICAAASPGAWQGWKLASFDLNKYSILVTVDEVSEVSGSLQFPVTSPSVISCANKSRVRPWVRVWWSSGLA